MVDPNAKPPEPGIYYDIDPEEYFSWDLVSNSRLSLFHRSPAHFQHGFKEDTPSLRLGSLVHAGVLEPLAIIKRYVFMPDYSAHPDNKTSSGERSFSAATKFVKQQQEAFRQLHHDKDVVTETEYNKMIGMSTALSQHEVAKNLLRDGQAEVTIVWDDTETGARCKARLDFLRDDCFVDVKTTADGSKFEKAIANYGYHRQAAFYQRGLEALTGKRMPCWIVPIESSAPFCCRAAEVSEAAIDVGNEEIDSLLLELMQCKASGVFPGYQSPESWDLPSWYFKSDEDTGSVSEWFESALQTIGGEA